MAYCAWATERDGQLVRYRPITEAEHQLIRSSQDRSDSHLQLRGDSSGDDAGSPASSTPSSPCGPASALATDASVNVDLPMQCSGEDALIKVGANVQLAYSSHNPVNSLPASEKGFYDVFGNAWEWAMDHFAPYPGFKLHPYYDDFSVPCFAGKAQPTWGSCMCVCATNVDETCISSCRTQHVADDEVRSPLHVSAGTCLRSFITGGIVCTACAQADAGARVQELPWQGRC
jgi:formylglycine-generating enzyme required for sulfatase activity